MGKEGKRSERPEFFAKGGSTGMFGKGHADPARSEYSGKASQGENEGASTNAPPSGEKDAYTSKIKMAKAGGSNEMFGKGHAGKKVPGISGKATQEG
jgi:hypothetical protein